MKTTATWMNSRSGNGYNGNFVESTLRSDVVMGTEKLDDVADSVEYRDPCASIRSRF